MQHADIEHMAQGFPPSHIGKDHEEVVIWLATQLIDVQQKLDAVLAKGMELAQEAAHVYAEYNKEMAPDVVCDGQTIQEFHDLANGWSSVDAYLNSVRADAIVEAASRIAAQVWEEDEGAGMVAAVNALAIIEKEIRAGEAK